MTDDEGAHPGRPRTAGTDEAILRAVLEIVARKGVSGVTVTGVAARAGVARATVYLRWPSRAALVGAAAKAVVGGDPFVLSGDLERDVRAGCDFIQTIFEAPYFSGILPELMRATLANPPEVDFNTLAPNRMGLATEYRHEAERQGFDPTIDPDLVFDILFGAGLAHLFATGTPPSREYVSQLATILTEGLRARPRTAGTKRVHSKAAGKSRPPR
jgi:AcrR family transcriptional regulator